MIEVLLVNKYVLTNFNKAVLKIADNLKSEEIAVKTEKNSNKLDENLVKNDVLQKINKLLIIENEETTEVFEKIVKLVQHDDVEINFKRLIEIFNADNSKNYQYAESLLDLILKDRKNSRVKKYITINNWLFSEQAKRNTSSEQNKCNEITVSREFKSILCDFIQKSLIKDVGSIDEFVAIFDLLETLQVKLVDFSSFTDSPAKILAKRLIDRLVEFNSKCNDSQQLNEYLKKLDNYVISFDDDETDNSVKKFLKNSCNQIFSDKFIDLNCKENKVFQCLYSKMLDVFTFAEKKCFLKLREKTPQKIEIIKSNFDKVDFSFFVKLLERLNKLGLNFSDFGRHLTISVEDYIKKTVLLKKPNDESDKKLFDILKLFEKFDPADKAKSLDKHIKQYISTSLNGICNSALTRYERTGDYLDNVHAGKYRMLEFIDNLKNSRFVDDAFKEALKNDLFYFVKKEYNKFTITNKFYEIFQYRDEQWETFCQIISKCSKDNVREIFNYLISSDATNQRLFNRIYKAMKCMTGKLDKFLSFFDDPIQFANFVYDIGNKEYFHWRELCNYDKDNNTTIIKNLFSKIKTFENDFNKDMFVKLLSGLSKMSCQWLELTSDVKNGICKIMENNKKQILGDEETLRSIVLSLSNLGVGLKDNNQNDDFSTAKLREHIQKEISNKLKFVSSNNQLKYLIGRLKYINDIFSGLAKMQSLDLKSFENIIKHIDSILHKPVIEKLLKGIKPKIESRMKDFKVEKNESIKLRKKMFSKENGVLRLLFSNAKGFIDTIKGCYDKKNKKDFTDSFTGDENDLIIELQRIYENTMYYRHMNMKLNNTEDKLTKNKGRWYNYIGFSDVDDFQTIKEIAKSSLKNSVKISDIQGKIFMEFQNNPSFLGKTMRFEKNIKGRMIDIFVPTSKFYDKKSKFRGIVIEVNGPSHYDSYGETKVKEAYKKQFVESQGYKWFEVDYKCWSFGPLLYEWIGANNCDSIKKRQCFDIVRNSYEEVKTFFSFYKMEKKLNSFVSFVKDRRKEVIKDLLLKINKEKPKAESTQTEDHKNKKNEFFFVKKDDLRLLNFDEYKKQKSAQQSSKKTVTNVKISKESQPFTWTKNEEGKKSNIPVIVKKGEFKNSKFSDCSKNKDGKNSNNLDVVKKEELKKPKPFSWFKKEGNKSNIPVIVKKGEFKNSKFSDCSKNKDGKNSNNLVVVKKEELKKPKPFTWIKNEEGNKSNIPVTVKKGEFKNSKFSDCSKNKDGKNSNNLVVVKKEKNKSSTVVVNGTKRKSVVYSKNWMNKTLDEVTPFIPKKRNNFSCVDNFAQGNGYINPRPGYKSMYVSNNPITKNNSNPRYLNKK